MEIIKNFTSPHILFLETPPTHFNITKDTNGYYKLSKDKRCAPLADVEVAHRMDWRNRILEEKFNNNNVTIISIADMLRSQWDAHIDGDSRLTPFEKAGT